MRGTGAGWNLAVGGLSKMDFMWSNSILEGFFGWHLWKTKWEINLLYNTFSSAQGQVSKK